MLEMLMLAAEDAAESGGEINWFEILVWGGGAIGGIIWILNVVVIALIISFFIMIRRANILPDMIRMQIEDLFESKEYREAIDLTETQEDFFSRVMHASLTEAPYGYPSMERAMEDEAEDRALKMIRNVSWLNLIGNIGPMLGLLGTVWGMIGAFFSMVAAGGRPEIKSLAKDIGVALVTTFLGLCVAIPALTFFAVLKNKIDALTGEALKTCQQMISSFKPSK